MKDKMLYGLKLILDLMIASGLILLDVCNCSAWLECIGRETVDNLQIFANSGICMSVISATLYVIFRAFRLWAENQNDEY